MSTTIDERIVSMQFDNKKFESNVKTSLSTLDKLKQSLNLTGAAKGFEEVAKASKKVDINPLANAVDSMKVKFSALEVIAVTALVNITNQAVNAGKRITSALTIEPVKTGFQEYETQINAIQTILANTQSKGTNLQQVIKALDELNHYADMTIYNFTEMTRNIGTFTAAGIGLETSVSAIKGIANLAAVSGSTSQQASTAMYQLSQALAAGTVKLMDWNSVVNAGMGGQVFQDSLKETARVHGIAIDQMIKDEGSFRETLQKGWLTSDILTETLSKFTGDLNESQLRTMGYTEEQIAGIIKMGQTANDAATKVKTFTQLFDTLKEAAQSGWTKSWELIIGDFEEAKELLTDVSDAVGAVIGKQADARNKILQEWKDEGGRTALIDSFKNAFEGLGSVVKPISEAFREIFPRITGKQLADITKALKDFTSHLKLSDEQSARLKATFKGLFSILEVAVNIIKAFTNGLSAIIGSLFGVSDGILGITSIVGDFLSGVAKAVNDSNIFSASINGVTLSINMLIDAFVKLINSSMGGFSSALSGVWTIIEKIGGNIAKLLSQMGEALGEAFKTGNLDNFIEVLNGSIFAGILLNIKKFTNGFVKTESDLIGKLDSMMGNITNILDSARASLQTWQAKLKADTLMKLASAVAVLAASLVVLSAIDEKKMSSALSGITVLFGELLTSMMLFNKIGTSGFGGTFSAINTMIGMSTAILILSGALKNISKINAEQLEVGMIGIISLTATIVTASKLMSSESASIMKGSSSLVVFAASMRILASVCKELSSLNKDEMLTGLAGIGGILATIVLFLKKVKIEPNVTIVASGIFILSGALSILSVSVKRFSSMSWDSIATGLVSIGVLLTELSVFTRTMGKSSHVMASATSVTIMSASLLILNKALQNMSTLSWDDIYRGLTAISISLIAVATAAKILPNENLLLVSGALPAVASSLVVLAEAFEKFGKLSWEQVAIGIVSSASSMTILSVALVAMGKVGSNVGYLLAASSALLILASSVKILSSVGVAGMVVSLVGLPSILFILAKAGSALKPIIPTLLSLSVSISAIGASLAILGGGLVVTITSLVTALFTLQTLEWDGIGKGLLMLSGIFTIIGVASTLLRPLIPSILSLSGSMAMLGLSCLTVAASLSLVATGLSALAVVGKDGADNIVYALQSIIKGFTEVLPSVINNIIKSAKTLILSFVDAIVECVPAIVNGIFIVITQIVASLAQYGPQIIDHLLSFLIDIINGLASRMPELVNAVAGLLGALFSSIFDAIGTVDTTSLLKAIGAVTLVTVLIRMLQGIIGMIPSAMVGIAGVSVVIAEISLILTAIGALAQIPGLEMLIGAGGNFLQKIGYAIGGFVGSIAGGLLAGITSGLPEIADNLSKFMFSIQPFVIGASKIDRTMVAGVETLANSILILSAANVLYGISAWMTGVSSFELFAQSISSLGKGLADFSKEVTGKINAEEIQNAAKCIQILTELSESVPKTGGLWQMLAGSIDIGSFGNSLKALGNGIAGFAKATKNVNTGSVESVANAGKVLVSLSKSIPKSEGLLQRLTGTTNIDNFGRSLRTLGKGIADFGKEIKDVNPNAVKAAGNAGKMLTSLARSIPETGGLFRELTGGINIKSFGASLKNLGRGIADFAKETKGLKTDTVTAAVSAGKMLTSLAKTIPQSGGLFSIFTGDKNIKWFASQLKILGSGLKDFSIEVKDFDSANVESAANAGKTLSSLAKTLPSNGGFFSIFTGGIDIKGFASDIKSLGKGLADFSKEVTGKINAEDAATAANVGSMLSSLAGSIPSDGGLFEVFTGSKDIGGFAKNLSALGAGLADFSEEVSGKIDADDATTAANFASVLAPLVDAIPNSKTIVSAFVGYPDLEGFSKKLPLLGEGLAKFSESVTGRINNEDASSASNIASMIAPLVDNIDKTGGLIDLIIGTKNLSKFASDLPLLGKGLAGFSESVAGKINIDSVNAAASAGSALASIYETLEDSGGFFSFFTGNKESLSDFGSTLNSFGKSIADFSNSVKDIDSDTMNSAVKIVKKIATIATDLKDETFTTKDLNTLSSGFKTLGGAYADFGITVGIINPEFIETAVSSLNKIKDFIISLTGMDTSGIPAFQQAMTQLGTTSMEGFIEAFAGAGVRISAAVAGLFVTLNTSISSNTSMVVSAFSRMIESSAASISSKSIAFAAVGIQMMTNLLSGVNSQSDKLTNIFNTSFNKTFNSIKGQIGQFKTVGSLTAQGLINGIKSYTGHIKGAFVSPVSEAVGSVRGYYDSFYSAGVHLAQGLADGINSGAYKAKTASKAMAEAVIKATRKALDINSPSKVLYEIGRYAVAGFSNALTNGVKTVYSAGEEIASASINGLSDSISKISELVSGDIDTQPTIRPVMDLSSVQSGVSILNSMLDNGIIAKRTLALASSAGVTVNQNALAVERINDALNSTVNKMLGKLNAEESNKTYVLETPVTLNGREIAKASAVYTQAELNKLEKSAARKGGKR